MTFFNKYSVQYNVIQFECLVVRVNGSFGRLTEKRSSSKVFVYLIMCCNYSCSLIF